MLTTWLIPQLREVQPVSASGWTNALCPAHGGDRASFGFRSSPDGQVGAVKCFHGCSLKQIAEGLGLTVEAFRRHPVKASKKVQATYDYLDEQGTLLYQVVRFENKELRFRHPDPSKKSGWAWDAQNIRRVLYQLPALAGHQKVYVVEGEKDADMMWLLDLPGTTNPCGANSWSDAFTEQLVAAGIQQVIILPDHDVPGATRGWTVARSCLGKQIQAKVMLLPGLPDKGDISDWIAAGHTREELDALVAATPWLTVADLPTDGATVDPSAHHLDPRLVEPFGILKGLSEYPEKHLLLAPLDAIATVLLSITDPTLHRLATDEAYLRLRVLRIQDMDAHKLIKAAMSKARIAAGTAPVADPVQLEKALAEAREQASTILYAADPLMEVAKELRRTGWGGDLKALMLVYLNMTTRLLPRRRGTLTGHTQVNGAPGSGKSFGLECVLTLFPHDSYELYDAGSPKVMIYDPVSYKHKVVIYSEADSLPGVARGDEDNPAASMLRTLMQHGEASYKVPIKDKESGSFVIQVIKKEGPTVLVVTTVDRVRGEQLDSRLFAVDVPEERGQKERALAAQADAEEHGSYPEPNPAMLAFQRFLQLSAPVSAVVPYVRAFNMLLGKSRVDARLLRDAARIQSLIKSVVIVRQAKRDHDEQGRLVATYEDYETVADLLVNVYENTVTGVNDKMRELVQAVAEAVASRVGAGSSVSQTRLASLLGITQPSVAARVKLAVARGWLTNLEHRPGHPADLRVGEPLPHQAGLPSVDQLRTWKPVRTPV